MAYIDAGVYGLKKPHCWGGGLGLLDNYVGIHDVLQNIKYPNFICAGEIYIFGWLAYKFNTASSEQASIEGIAFHGFDDVGFAFIAAVR